MRYENPPDQLFKKEEVNNFRISVAWDNGEQRYTIDISKNNAGMKGERHQDPDHDLENFLENPENSRNIQLNDDRSHAEEFFDKTVTIAQEADSIEEIYKKLMEES